MLTYVQIFLSIQHQGIFCNRKKNISYIISTAEKKILIALCYYVIFAVFMFTTTGLTTADTDSYIEAIETYFQCQALGHLPNQTSQCDPKEYQQYTYPVLGAFGFFLFGFVSTANLTFVINWSTITKFCSNYKKQKSSNVTYSNTTSCHVYVTDISQLL